MTLENWEYERAAVETDATGVAVITVATDKMLVIDAIHATEFNDVGGEVVIKRNGVPIIWATISHDSVDLLAGTKIRAKVGSSITLDVKANINVTMSGALYGV